MPRAQCDGDRFLAINGGSPVRSAPMPDRVAFGPDEEASLQEAIRHYRDNGKDPAYQGVFEERYCREFEKAMGGGHADAVATGTAALHVALAALQLPRGSEVIVSPITDPGTLAAILSNGLVPRVADAEPGSFNMGVDQVAARLTPETTAVVVVHAGGQAAAIRSIVDVARSHGVKVLEDCSQAHGAFHHGRPVGSFGDIAAFSTMYRKAHITGSCGGVVYSQNEHLYRLARAHADRGKPFWQSGFDDRNPATFLFPALNLHSDEFSMAIGLASLKRLPDTLARRRRYLTQVIDGLAAARALSRPRSLINDDSPFFHPVQVDPARLRCSKVEFAKAVMAEGIPLNPNYCYLVVDWPWLAPLLADDFSCPNARQTLAESYCLYVNENYGEAEARDTVEAILKVEAAFLR